MLQLSSDILISKDGAVKYQFSELQDCSIQSAWDEITDTAEIILRNAFTKQNKQIKNEIQRGQQIAISIGYSPIRVERFTGYISKVNTDSPFRINCEDAAWRLKQKAITKYSKKNLTIKTLLNDLLTLIGEYITVNTIDADIGTWLVQNGTIIEVLDNLKTNFGLLSFFRNGELFIGYPTILSTLFPMKYGNREVAFNFDGPDANIISHDLSWKDDGDIRQVLKGVSIKSDNTKIIRYAYYLNGVPSIKDGSNNAEPPEGNLVTRFQYGISQAELDKYILRELQLINYTGFYGNFTTFGTEIRSGLGGIVRHGDKVTLTSLKEPEKNGKYMVKGVTVEFGQNGYRQQIEIDQKLTS